MFYKFVKIKDVTKYKNNSNGFSLMEMILTISIFLILMTAAFFTYQVVSERSKVNRATNELALIKNGIDELTENHVIALNNTILLNSKNIPTNMINGNDIIHPWNGKIIISAYPGDNRFYNISYFNLPIVACINMISGSKGMFNMVKNDSGELISDNISDISIFCSELKNNDKLIFSNYKTIIASSGNSTSASISASTIAASISRSVSLSTSYSIMMAAYYEQEQAKANKIILPMVYNSSVQIPVPDGKGSSTLMLGQTLSWTTADSKKIVLYYVNAQNKTYWETPGNPISIYTSTTTLNTPEKFVKFYNDIKSATYTGMLQSIFLSAGLFPVFNTLTMAFP